MTTEMDFTRTNPVQKEYELKIEIQEPETSNKLIFYYIKGRFVMPDNFHSLPVDDAEDKKAIESFLKN